MKNTLKGYLAGILSTIVLIGSVAYASSGTKALEVIFDNIKVYKDNVLCETKDANGKVVEPFIYNGTTYMPVRATAQLAGMDVTWDGATKSVHLWDKIAANDTLLLDVCMPYNKDAKTYLSSKGQSFEMSGEKYSNGVSGESNKHILFNLNSKYSSLECIIGHIDHHDKAKTVTFVVDEKTIKTVELKEECLPQKIVVPLNYGQQLKIIINVPNHTYYYDGTVGIGNMIVK